ncbi:outer membrane beta-barrel protein [Amylibacter sp. IMCC11727]|uniref:outer membrane protein n=1 Tax=Amylibacter sp. IMCC11727 TaxID=3039851 RepID=UPI00244DF916|nr:outer membrane beta-barrel protein [Amylibacter sp. IMCC11727]WGI21418.1 outer membrane beta-barrel protein [Amylibacter sp. IMCC11727]
MNTFKTTALTLGALLVSSAAFADGHSNAPKFYGHVFGGYTNAPDLSFSGTIGGAPQTVATEFGSGYNFGIAVGKNIGAWSNSKINTRAEIELSYSRANVDAIDFSGNGVGFEPNTSGSISTTNLFANVLFDFKTSTKWTPYAGFGAGVAFVDNDLVYGPNVRISDSDQAFAAQLIAGTSYELSEQMDLTFDARYSRAFNVSSSRLNGAGASTGTVTEDVDNLRVNVGVRFKF